MSDIPGPAQSLWLRLLPREHPSLFQGFIVGVVCLALGLGIRYFLTSVVTGAPFLTFFPLIVVASMWGGVGAGMAVVLGAALLALAGITANNSAPGLTVTVILFMVSGIMMVGLIFSLQRALVQLRASEETADVMAREMRHRVSNVLQLVQSIAQLTIRTSPDPAAGLSLFEARLIALAKSHRLSSGTDGAPSDLRSLLLDLLGAYGLERVDLSGPSVRLDENLAPRIGLVIHELATNAAKYGAFSVSGGKVSVSWRNIDGATELTWLETAGPAVIPPTKNGFGSKLIPAAIPVGIGEAEVVYAPRGVQAYLRF